MKEPGPEILTNLLCAQLARAQVNLSWYMESQKMPQVIINSVLAAFDRIAEEMILEFERSFARKEAGKDAVK